jgi:hypothetical protein
MFVTVVAVLCHLLVGNSICEEQIVTDSNLTSGLTFMDCMAGAQAPLAKWKGEHPIYRSDAYRIERYKCVPGHYELRGRA